ncbi:MAG: hypothetical protein VKO21_02650 [Candidatus Sericytochromatia bacterium]|nr:hypothetical protein [Candidatus Sericytochromatia bacterium]
MGLAGCGAVAPGFRPATASVAGPVETSGLFRSEEEKLVRKALLKVPGNKLVTAVQLTPLADHEWAWTAHVKVNNIGPGPYWIDQPWGGTVSFIREVVTLRYLEAAPGDRSAPGPWVRFHLAELH